MRSKVVLGSSLLAAAAIVACTDFEARDAPTLDAGVADSAPETSPIDAPGRPCRLDQAFGPAVRLEGAVNTPANEVTARFSKDRLTLYFARIETNPTKRELYVARRASVEANFVEASPIEALNTSQTQFGPALGQNEAELFFTSDRVVPDAGGYRDIWRAAIDGMTFNDARPIFAVNTAAEESRPYLASNGAALYFTRAERDPSTVSDIFVSYRRNDGTFGAPVAVLGGVNKDETPEADPVLTPDELVIYFRRGPSGSRDEGNVYRAERADRAAPFSEAKVVESLRTVGAMQAPSWISPDECTILLSAREEANAGDIYIAERPR